MDNPAGQDRAPSLRAIFFVFLKMGTLAVGGVYSMLTFFQRELVERRGWLTQDEFAEGVTIGQMTPGPPIVNTGIYVGYRLRGFSGAMVATVALVLPGLVVVLTLGYLYIKYKEAPFFGKALRGVGAAVVGLLVSVIYRLAKDLTRTPGEIVFAVVAFLALLVLKLNPIGLIAVSALAGCLVFGVSRGVSD
jgi:chromate transporter